MVRIQQILPPGRRVPPENLHLTLAFLDDQRPETLGDLHTALEGVRVAEFSVKFGGLGWLGGEQAKLCFVSVEQSEPLKALHRKVHSAIRDAGVILPRAPFRPHVTLARFGSVGVSPDAFAPAALLLSETGVPEMRVGAFSLYRSTLRAEGALHDELARYPLA